MKTDIIILQIVSKVKSDHGIQLRTKDAGDRGKNFLERYAAYAITTTRKLLMGKLKRNAPSEKNDNGKRVKKKIIAFNPDVHIKKEAVNDAETTEMHLEINNETSEQEASTLTMERSKDDIKAFMMEVLGNYFTSGGCGLNSTKDFETLWKNEVERIRDSQEQVLFHQETEEMPSLQDATGFPTLDESEIGYDIDEDRVNMISEEEEEEEYTGEMNCGECDLLLDTCQTHNGESLKRAFGPDMKCVGKGCKKTLLQCFNEGSMTMRGAYICGNCKKQECRQMKCTVCYFKENEKTNETRRRRRST